MGKLFINGNRVELPPNFKFARTKQANDLGAGLNNRQTNYTQSIKLPKTKVNTIALGFLGTLGNLSNTPYTISNIRYVNDSGEDEIFNGTGVVKSSNKYYNLSIYDGFISFYKAIENRVVTDVGISELNHLKSIDTVIETWINSNLNYRYNIADYNGNALVGNAFNIDYLVPSVKFAFIWQKIHEFAGFTYDGSIFQSEKFNNLWITYPKSNNESIQEVLDVLSINQTRTLLINPLAVGIGRVYIDGLFKEFSDTKNEVDTQYIKTESTQYNDAFEGRERFLNNKTITIKKAGKYKLEVTGIVYGTYDFESLTPDYNFVDGNGDPVKFTFDGNYTNNFIGELHLRQISKTVPLNSTFTHAVYNDYEAGDVIELDLTWSGNDTYFNADITTKLSVVTGGVIDFEEAFIDFSIKKFINEGMFFFGLTPFKDKYTNNLTYLTTDEVINNREVVDWSADKGKFVGVTNETYILKGYAQRNNFKYKYNDDNFNHNDGYFTIPNKSIKDETDVIKSSFFSPDALTNKLNNVPYNVFPIWTKEPKEDGTIKYKELSNRFYIMGSDYVEEFIYLVSERANNSGSATAYYRENFNQLSFNDLLTSYYQPLKEILQRANLITANVYLTDADVSDVRFEKPRFIKELGSYYLINKISNYVKKGISKVELTKVERRVVPSDLKQKIIQINSTLVPPPNNGDWNITTDIKFINYIPEAFVVIKLRPLNDLNNSFDSYVKLNGTGKATHTFSFKPPLAGSFTGQFAVEVIDNTFGVNSNTSSVNVPNSFTDFQFVRFWVNVKGLINPDNPPIVYRKIKYEFFNYSIDSNDVKIQVDNQPEQTADASSPTEQRETFVAFNDGFKEYTITVRGNGRTRTQTVFIN